MKLLLEFNDGISFPIIFWNQCLLKVYKRVHITLIPKPQANQLFVQQFAGWEWVFRMCSHWGGKSTGDRWISLPMASDAEGIAL